MIETQKIDLGACRFHNCGMPQVEEILIPEIKKDRLGCKQFSS
jgi:hypothetical protein